MSFFRSKKVIYFAIFLIALGLIIFLNYYGFIRAPRELFHQATLSARFFLYRAATLPANYLTALFSASDLRIENNKLTDENLKFRAEIAKIEETKRENETLRNQLELDSDAKNELILANLVGYEPSNFTQEAWIDKGEKDGIILNTAVVKPGAVLIGRVTEVFRSTAKVMFIADINSAITIYTQTSRNMGTLKGGGNGNLIVELISQEGDVEFGEKVLTSGMGGVLPKDLFVGEVGEILSNDFETLKKARVIPAVNVAILDVVFVLKK